MRPMKRASLKRCLHAATIAVLLVFGAPSRADITFETLYFINEDGASFVNYQTTRSGIEAYDVFFPKGVGLGNYLYVFPNQYRFDVDSSSDYDVLRFNQGSYALIKQGDFDAQGLISVSKDGTRTLRTWDGSKAINDHFGLWNDPDNYTHFAIAWVFPKQFDIIDYRSNREGDWVKRQNTLTYFGSDVNDLTFELTYRPRTQSTYQALQESLDTTEDIVLEQSSDQVKVILSDTILFPSGSTRLTDGGAKLLKGVAATLNQDPTVRAAVHGHTDDIPVSGALQQYYKSNWELSAARAMTVIHELVDAGVAAERLQAHAFGSHQPRVPNTDDESRAENRRIELVLIPGDE